MAVERSFENLKPIATPAGVEPYLLTPGSLTTGDTVKKATLRDRGSWGADFRAMSATVRREFLAMIGEGHEDFDCVLMQGSGTFVVEAMLGSFLPKDSKTLVLMNGAYGQRIAKTLSYLGRDMVSIDKGDYLPPSGAEVTAAIEQDPAISHVVVVHCETSSGILNPIEEIAQATAKAGRKLLIDAMSAFGAIAIDADKIPYAALVSSANKCIEEVPGFGFVMARKSELELAKGNSHSLSLDLYDQWQHMEKTGQWRFTPPTHVVAAFIEALRLHRAEGGVTARGARYARNRDVLVSGMRALGFETLLKDRWLSPVIVTFFCPVDPNFNFDSFYERMKAKGFVIYPGKLTIADSFRIGCIGQIDEHVMRKVIDAAAASLKELGVTDAQPSKAALFEREKLAA